MPPGRWLKMPHWAKPQAMASEPMAVTSQDSSEIAPTLAMLEGNMMIPDPIMLTVTMNVSCVTLIFLPGSAMVLSPLGRGLPLFADDVGMEGDAAVHLFLVHPLHFVVEAGETVEGFLEGEEV